MRQVLLAETNLQVLAIALAPALFDCKHTARSITKNDSNVRHAHYKLKARKFPSDGPIMEKIVFSDSRKFVKRRPGGKAFI